MAGLLGKRSLNRTRERFGNSRHAAQLVEARPPNGCCRTEMFDERLFAGWADAAQTVQRRFDLALTPDPAVVRNCEAMRFVANALHEVQCRRVARQQHGLRL